MKVKNVFMIRLECLVMNSNKLLKIHLVVLVVVSRDFLDLKGSKINLDKEDNKEVDQVNLVIYLKSLKNSLEAEVVQEEAEVDKLMDKEEKI